VSTDPLFDLSERVVVITGASSGIGESAARCFAERGATVVAAARRKERLDDLVADLPGALAVPCDVSDPAACQDLVDRTLQTHGRVDVLVNNAGSQHITPAEDETPEGFSAVVDVNLNSVFTLSAAAARPMLAAGKGSIITVASIFGLVGAGQIPQAAYAASKGAVVNLTRELAAQWARRGVRVNAVAPAFFATEMTSEMFDDEGADRWLRRKTPMGRPGELAELHGALVYLASDASSYVTGTTLAVDGGWTAV
jgi:NAD(P)-dependent dehydrogenase (short-subunit alcohol dehydrogenase family)